MKAGENIGIGEGGAESFQPSFRGENVEGGVLPGAESPETVAKAMPVTFDLAEARLIEAASFWNRTPHEGGFASGWATDGPWRQIMLDWDDWGRHETKPLRRTQLWPWEVDRRDEASAWVQRYIENEVDCRLIWLALYQKADGRRPDWDWIMRRIGYRRGRDGVRMRYERGIGRIAKGLNRDGIAVRPAVI